MATIGLFFGTFSPGATCRHCAGDAHGAGRSAGDSAARMIKSNVRQLRQLSINVTIDALPVEGVHFEQGL